jgi:hypothetical protein
VTRRHEILSQILQADGIEPFITTKTNVGPQAYGATMTASKLPKPKKQTRNVFAPRAIGDGDPTVYTPQEREIIFRLGLHYGRGLMKSRKTTNYREQAEAFRRKYEIISIFRGLPEIYRIRPCSQATMYKVRDGLEKIGIAASERALMRDYRELGGAKWLRGVKPFAPEEDASSPFLAVTAKAPS